MADVDLPVAFRFTLAISGESAVWAFREVGGLGAGLEEAVETGDGANRFVHRLPQPATAAPLRLKHGTDAPDGALVRWCRATLEGGFAAPIAPRDLRIALLNDTGAEIAAWAVSGAWPVKWKPGGLDAMRNEIPIEEAEFAYAAVSRVT